MKTRVRKRERSWAYGYDRPPMRSRWLTYVFLVIVAIIVGVITSGLPSRSKDPALRVAPPESTTVPSSPSSSSVPRSTTSTTSTTTPQGHDPASVTVLVANGTSVDGAATRRGDELRVRGYVVLTPVDAEQPSSTTRVFYAINSKVDARAVASVLDVPDAAVAPLPDPLPVADLQAATVLVVVGADLANE
jgi:cytoskeletal protein RodZ